MAKIHAKLMQMVPLTKFTAGIKLQRTMGRLGGNKIVVVVVGCNIVEYTTAFLYSDWLYFCGMIKSVISV